MTTKIQATIEADGSFTVITTGGSKTCTAHPPTPLRTGDILRLIEQASDNVQVTGDHWYIGEFAVKTIAAWLEIELARNTRIDVNVRRTFTLEVG